MLDNPSRLACSISPSRSAGAGKQNADIVVAFQKVRRLHDAIQRMGHTVGADISHDEFVLKAVFRRQRRVPGANAVATCIDTVTDHVNFCGIYTPADEVAFECVGQGRHGSAALVEKKFQLLQ